MKPKMKLALWCVILICASLCSFFLGWKFNEMKKRQPDVPFVTDAVHTKWEGSYGTYQKNVIRDKQTAVNVATQIYMGMDKNNDYSDCVPRMVAYNDETGVWIVTFGKDPSLRFLGGDCRIALQEEDGKVLRIWFGE